MVDIVNEVNETIAAREKAGDAEIVILLQRVCEEIINLRAQIGDVAGQHYRAQAGQTFASRSTSPDREGQGRCYSSAQRAGAARRFLPAPHDPSPAARATAIRARVQASEAVLDTFKTKDGRAVGDLDVRDLVRLAAAREKTSWVDAREAELFRLIAKRVGHAPIGAKVRDVIDEDVIVDLIAQSAVAASMRSRISFTAQVGHDD